MAKSQSGPVRVIRRFTPEPATPSQEEARLLQAIAILTGKLADLDSLRIHDRQPQGLRYTKRRISLSNRLISAQNRLLQIRGAAEEAINHNPVGNMV